ncbi:MAG: ribonuclease R [Gammaproteobacteria bacterium]|jgi:ribonuclease R
MPTRIEKTDTHAQREALKYDRPIASREFILEILTEEGKPLTREQLAEKLGYLDETDLEALARRLKAMERDGQLIRNRRKGYGPVNKMDLICGHVLAHPDGFGFLVPDDGSDDLFLSARQMRQVIHRDRVLAHVSGIDRRGRREGAIVEILERNTRQVVGRFFNEAGVGFVVPDNKRITHDIVVPSENQGQAQNGQIVVAELIEQPSKQRQPIGKVVEILGEHMAPGMEIDVAVRAHEIPHLWPDAVEREVGQYTAEVPESAIAGREDIRLLPLVTIDGADARDFDDAVYCEREGNGWRLLVAIADVSYYVRPTAALDVEAQVRGNSVYFPGRVIPMLPEVLSNGLCSINPEVNRLCMVCEMHITNTGRVKDYRFFEAVMRSHARLIYDDVAALLDGDKALRKKYKKLVPHLENLYSLYKAFFKQRIRRGAIEFETTETVIEFGEQKKIERIVPLQRNDAHRLIEECMIAANVCAASYLADNDMPALYRVHDAPSEDKLVDLRDFLKSLGLTMAGGSEPEPKHYGQLLAQVRNRPDWHLIQTVMLRSLNQAVYSPDNLGHFGLALDVYGHFTSPIRRYPDLLVHRAIKHVLSGQIPEQFIYTYNDMQVLGESCSMTERRADEATRDVMDWLKCEYMMDKVGEVFDGIITSVTSFGLFIELQDIYVEGLVHVTALTRDYYHFDPAKRCLIGERTNKKFRLTDKVQVKVVRVDLDDKKIDFELIKDYGSETQEKEADSQAAGRKASKRRSSKKRSAKKGKKAVGTRKADTKSSDNTAKSGAKKKPKAKVKKAKKRSAASTKGKADQAKTSPKRKRRSKKSGQQRS